MKADIACWERGCACHDPRVDKESIELSPKAITVEVRDVYGQTMYYPACDEAKLFAQIAGTKTLTLDVLNKIKALGYGVTATRTVTF